MIPTFAVAPEYLLLCAAGIWVVCGAIVGTRAPPLIRIEAGLFFVTLGVTGGGAGISVFLPAGQSGAVLTIAIVAFAVLPVVSTAYLLRSFPHRMIHRGRVRN